MNNESLKNLNIDEKKTLASYKEILIDIIASDLKDKSSNSIKIHTNQLFKYIAKDISKKDIYEAKLLLFDYLNLMKKNDIINTLSYLKFQMLLKIKYFVKIYPILFNDKIKKDYLSFLTLISPKLNTKAFYKRRIGKDINLDTPATFNEKIQWLKLNYLYPNNLVTRCADKVEVRNFIKENGCEEILTEVIGIYNNVDEINFDELPNKFVLKWNFGCGYNIICQNKQKLNVNVTKKILKKWGKSKFHLYNSELQYKDIKKKIICEKFIEPKQGILPEDYKFYCFNGKALYVMICYERDKGKPKFYFFDRDWNLARINERGKNAPENFTIEKPKKMDKMFDYADKLSKEFPFVRVDLYNVEDKIYFGELTFTPSAGLDTGYTDDGQIILGNIIDIGGIKCAK